MTSMLAEQRGSIHASQQAVAGSNLSAPKNSSVALRQVLLMLVKVSGQHRTRHSHIFGSKPNTQVMLAHRWMLG